MDTGEQLIVVETYLGRLLLTCKEATRMAAKLNQQIAEHDCEPSSQHEPGDQNKQHRYDVRPDLEVVLQKGMINQQSLDQFFLEYFGGDHPIQNSSRKLFKIIARHAAREPREGAIPYSVFCLHCGNHIMYTCYGDIPHIRGHSSNFVIDPESLRENRDTFVYGAWKGVGDSMRAYMDLIIDHLPS